MRRASPTLAILFCALALDSFCLDAEAGTDELRQGFTQPPDTARPWVLWYWMDGNVTREASTSAGYMELGDSAGVALRDVNGDGLLDRVIRPQCTPYTNWLVQLNTGSGFAPLMNWGPLDNQGLVNDDTYTGIEAQSGYDTATLMDINGDGLPDRVMSKASWTGTNQNYFVVQLSQGPFPDLLAGVSNGVGGGMTISYKPSTQYDNREDPNNPNSRRLLPFVMQMVASVSVSDGLYPAATTSYLYEGGYWSAARREFHGFSHATVTDPLGLAEVHWFHQAGGRTNSAVGEYQDNTNNIGKNGMEFRVETSGSDGRLYRLVLHKVEDAALGSGRHFGFVSQTLTQDYPGNGSTNYRATAQQFGYDLANGNQTNAADYGEVTNIVVSSQGFTDIGNDSTYHFTIFAALVNTNIVDKPQREILTTDSAGQNILRETLDDYDGNTGNVTLHRQRMCPTCYLTNGFGYDTYNNRTSATNEASVITVTLFDSTYQTFPVQQTVAGTFISTAAFDARSGKPLLSTDIKGLVTSNSYDTFFRTLETDVSITTNGSPSQWLDRYQYGLGMSGGISSNYVCLRRSDGVDPVNGHESWTYTDGLGRPLQFREQAEANGFRVTDTVHDKRGNVQFVSLPYFSLGNGFSRPSGTELGSLRLFDPIGRDTNLTAGVNGTFSSGLLTSTSATGGETGSPIGSSSIAYNDGNDPWTLVLTDEAGKVHKYSLNAYGWTNKITEVTSSGNFVSLLSYTLAGDLTNLTDSASNQFQWAVNDLGQVVAMADPDMGVWQYLRDCAGRIRKEIDADNQSVLFGYDDLLGRLHTRQVFDFQGTFAYGLTNVWDHSDDPNFTVYPGQLYETIDKEGWQKNGYDVRGRPLKTARFLVKNGQTYTNQSGFDDLDRPVVEIYPNSGPTITNLFDSGLNLSQVRQVGGSNTVFFAARGFTPIGQPLGVNFGNGVVTTNDYYPNSKRPRRIVTYKPGSTNIQDLTYTYDKVANMLGIADGVYTGSASAAISSVLYDDLHRLLSLVRPAIGTNATGFSYTGIGSFIVNAENGAGTYNFGSRMPHAVKSANGKNYAYDANGNMWVRGNQRLGYDPENHMNLVATATYAVTFGYAGDGSRLWKLGTNGLLQVWIGGNYEEKSGQILFHIMAGDRFVLTFDKTGTNVVAYYHPDHLHSTAIETDQNGNKSQHYEYMAYGQDRFTESATAFPLSRRYTSQVKDEDTGLYYYGARYYDPQLGSFIQPDDAIPDIFKPQGYNRYSYALDNPFKFVDRNGHAPQLTTITYDPGTGRAQLGYVDQHFGQDYGIGLHTPLEKPTLLAAHDALNAAAEATYDPNVGKLETTQLYLTGAGLTILGVVDLVPGTGGATRPLTRVAERAIEKTIGRKLAETTAEAEGEILSRLGTSRESAARLGRKAAEAEEQIGIHGISTTAGKPLGPASQASREAVESKFPVHDTPTRRDPLHRTVELPKPVTPETAKQFNEVFGRE